jgi:hypothetical protein
MPPATITEHNTMRHQPQMLTLLASLLVVVASAITLAITGQEKDLISKLLQAAVNDLQTGLSALGIGHREHKTAEI